MNALSLDHVESHDALVAWRLDPASQPFKTPDNGHTVQWRGPKDLNMSLTAGVHVGLSPESGRQQPDQYETLLLGLLAKMTNLPAEDTEQEMGVTLKRVCELFGLEWAALWRWSREDPASFMPMHYSPAKASLEGRFLIAGDRIEESRLQTAGPVTNGKARYPWVTAEVQRGKVVVFSQTESLPAEAALDKAALLAVGIRSGVIIPLCAQKEVLGAVSFGMTTAERCWHEPLVKRLQALAAIFAQGVVRTLCEERLRATEALLRQAEGQIKLLKEGVQAQGEYLGAEVQLAHPHEKIIGRSQGIRKVLHQTEQVAPADCSVLITGETGTGKELVAQEIHRLSRRKDRALVLVNCAALPSELVESELFGRERGAYTGALSSQVGRFELANGSTIFLDEVGELPMGVQAKLLRVLQQGEFQRLGSPKTHHVDVRIIAATNRDLAEEVRKGKFREDLYYRLCVFPIQLPPLRERAEDIPALVFAFMGEFATRMGKQITKVPRKSMELLQRHYWPGNIRELRNAIEHSVILTSGDTLKLTLSVESPTREAPPATLAELERQHILKTLGSTNWRIKGHYGAAARLGVHPSTLYGRMQKLGIPYRGQKENTLTCSSQS